VCHNGPRFLGGITDKYDVQGYDPAKAKALFFDIYINTFAKPEQNIGYPGEGCRIIRSIPLTRCMTSLTYGISLALDGLQGRPASILQIRICA
jgi:hypothetical protein